MALAGGRQCPFCLSLSATCFEKPPYKSTELGNGLLRGRRKSSSVSRATAAETCDGRAWLVRNRLARGAEVTEVEFSSSQTASESRTKPPRREASPGTRLPDAVPSKPTVTACRACSLLALARRWKKTKAGRSINRCSFLGPQSFQSARSADRVELGCRQTSAVHGDRDVASVVKVHGTPRLRAFRLKLPATMVPGD